jgi:NAD(P)-dependent dehydrogenase (short-subunit alcohol dehydrogenase family)
VVSLSSVAARQGAINFDDLQATAKYDAMQTYSQSKLACLMFAFELQRRSEGGRWGVSSIAAHPGISKTDLLLNAPGSSRLSVRGVMRTLLGFMFQPVSQGALPTLFAATSPEAEPGGYYGPNRMSETRGFPSLSKIPLAAQDTKTAARLWAISEQLANVSVPVLESASSRGRLL